MAKMSTNFSSVESLSHLLKKSNGFCGIPSPVFSAILNQRGLRQKTQYMKPSEGYPYQFIKEKPM
jgi:hypothetical protein